MYIKLQDFLNENNNIVNGILDKINKSGINSLSNHEKELLSKSFDGETDLDEIIKKNKDKYKDAKKVITDIVPLSVSGTNLDENVGRYLKLKKGDPEKVGIIKASDLIYEIVGTQKHYGHVNGKYTRNKIGYRVVALGQDGGDIPALSFGSVADVDDIIFVDNISEEDAIKHNNIVLKEIGF